MLQKKPLAGRNVEVTFRMPELDGVVELNLCGDFNGWQAKGEPLHTEADGSWSATLVLEAGKSYRFRYNDNQGRWHNDWEADGYVPNEFGSEDSVLDLTHVVKKPVAPKAPSREPAKKRAAPRKSPTAKRVKAGTPKGSAQDKKKAAR
jgi:1,4-alpha-glucan branching enzyme